MIYWCSKKKKKSAVRSFLVDANLIYTCSLGRLFHLIWEVIDKRMLSRICIRLLFSCRSFIKVYTSALNHFPTNNVYVYVDFNYPDIDWSHLHRLLSKLQSHPDSSNILDLILTTFPHTKSPVLQTDGCSGHNLLQFSINVPVKFADVQLNLCWR